MNCDIRPASVADVPAVAAAVGELLVELGAEPPPGPALEAAARDLVDSPQAGALLVAQAQEQTVGVLGASWQLAIHVPGRYALIQDLWVHPTWRGQAIGGELLRTVVALAHEHGIARLEVGLPRDDYAGLQATAAFYRANGFQSLGERMRRTLR